MAGWMYGMLLGQPQYITRLLVKLAPKVKYFLFLSFLWHADLGWQS